MQLEMIKNAFKRSSPQYFNDYKEILDMPEVDAVVIATPSFLHQKMTIDALKANKDVFLEKPVAPTIDATDAIIMALAKTDRILQVGLVYRYSNLYRTMAHLIEEGRFGNVMMAYCKEYRDNFPNPWFYDDIQSGGAILDKNCHHLDLFNWFIRSPPKKVYAMGGQHLYKTGHKIQCAFSSHNGEALKDPTIVDHANVLIEYENGAKSNLGLCMYEIEPIEGLEIGFMGNNGSWALAKKDEKLIIAGGPIGNKEEIFLDYYSDNEGAGHIGCQTERREFLKCLETRKQPYVNLKIARDSCVVALAAEKSIKEMRIVSISEFFNPEVNAVFKKLGYDKPSKTPPVFTLETPKLKLKLKKKLKFRKKQLEKDLKSIEEEINLLTK
ncbi:MAG: Gfo/Idh/MocA family protein [Promethearchaeota archaeon]